MKKSESTWIQYLRKQGYTFTESTNEFESRLIEKNSTCSSTRVTITPLTNLGITKVSGLDAAKFLQAQFTNDVSKINNKTSGYFGYCDLKGRILANGLMFQESDHYKLIMPRELIESIIGQLSKYILRSDVTLSNVTDTNCLLGLSGNIVEKELLSLKGDKLELKSFEIENSVHNIAISLSKNHILLMTKEENIYNLWDWASKQGNKADLHTWQSWEIKQELAQVLPATQGLFLPQMLNLDLNGAVSFDKGCYPGQEIVARSQYRGKIKRKLYRAVSVNQAQPGDRIISNDNKNSAAGLVINTAYSQKSGCEMLLVLASDRISENLRLENSDDAWIKIQ